MPRSTETGYLCVGQGKSLTERGLVDVGLREGTALPVKSVGRRREGSKEQRCGQHDVSETMSSPVGSMEGGEAGKARGGGPSAVFLRSHRRSLSLV